MVSIDRNFFGEFTLMVFNFVIGSSSFNLHENIVWDPLTESRLINKCGRALQFFLAGAVHLIIKCPFSI